MFKKIYYLLFIGVLLSTSACKKFLEETSPDITIPTSVQHYEELLYGEGYPKPQTALLEVLSDNTEFHYAAADVRNVLSVAFFPSYLYKKDIELYHANSLTTIWVNGYKAIAVCNLVIEGLEKLSPSKERDHVLAQAHILRAHHYFHLVNIYGEPYRKDNIKRFGIPIKTTALAEDKKYKRNTVNEVYDLLNKDLDIGLRLISKDKSTPLNGEMNYLSALTLASRVALFMENYDKVIELGIEYLRYNVQLLNPADNIAIGKFISVQNKEITMLFGGSYNELTGVYLNSSLTARSSLVVADELFNLYAKNLKQGEEDIRLKWYFEKASTGLRYPKKSDASKRNAYRAMEVYLNLSEAYFAKGNQQIALNFINDVRKARILNFNSFSLSEFKDEMLQDLIEDERRREFAFEDFRWFDLRRYNRTLKHDFQNSEGVFRMTIKPNDWLYTMQVPLLEQARNPELELIPHEELTPVKIN